MKRRIVILAIVFATMMAFAGTDSADASCGIYGKVFYIYQTTSYAYIYVAPQSTALPSYAYYYYSADPELISTLASAMSANYTVYISGSVTTCPTSGAWRYGGTISYANVFRNY